MCGRFAPYLPPEAIRAIFGTRNPPVNFPPSWNVAPTDPALVIRRHPDTGERHLDVLRWGLIPYRRKDLKAARKPINARSETAGSSGMFRDALARRRCLPSDVVDDSDDSEQGRVTSGSQVIPAQRSVRRP